MSIEVPEKLRNFHPPDYYLEGEEVLELIKGMPDEPVAPINRKPNDRELEYMEIRKLRYPDRDVPQLGIEAVEVLYYAVQEMHNIFKNYKESYSISKYNVLTSIHFDFDIAVVAFCPKVETFIQGIPFEVCNQGVWQNGPGVCFYYSLSSHALIKKVYMR